MHRIPEFFQAWFSEQRLVAGVGRLQYRDAASQVLPTAMLVDKGAWLACGYLGSAFQLLEYQWRECRFDKPTVSTRAPFS